MSLAENIVSKLTKGSVIRKQVTIWYYKTASKSQMWKAIVVFGDSISNFCGKCKRDFNRNINSGRARFQHFAGATSKDLQCYVDATLQDTTCDAVIIYVGVNDILNNQSPNQKTQLMYNLRKISAKRKSYGVKHVFVSGLLYTSKIKENLLVDIN